MTDHRKRVANAIRIAKEVHSKKLLQDIYPTSYMPHVGRQVMQGGGVPEEETIYDVMGGVAIPGTSQYEEERKKEEGYRQPLGERVHEGISKGFGEHRLGLSPENQAKYDPTGMVQNLFAAPADAFLRAPGAVIGGASALGAGLYGMLPGVDETQTNKLQRDLKVLGDVGMIEAGNVRPRAPTDVSGIVRSGELLPPEPIAPAFRIARDVKERQTITPEGAPALEGPSAAPAENIDMSRRRFLQGSAAAVGSTMLPKGTLPALTEAAKPAATVYDASKVSSLMGDMLGQRVRVTDNPELGRYVDVGALAENVQEYPAIYGIVETPEGLLDPSISRWEMVSPDYSRLFADNFYSGDQSFHRMSADSVAALKAEMEAKLGYEIPKEDFNQALKDQLKSQVEIHELKHDMSLVAEEGLDHDFILDGMKARARAAAHSVTDKPKSHEFLDTLGRVTPEEILEKAYGVPKDRVQAVLDEPIAMSYDGERTGTLRNHLEAIYGEASDWWWEDISPSDKREIRKAWNDEAKKIASAGETKPQEMVQQSLPLEEPTQLLNAQRVTGSVSLAEPPAQKLAAPKTIDELRQVQAEAKQAFEEAKVAVRENRDNPDLKAQIAQRQQELMAATKELEKAESSLAPKAGTSPNAPKVLKSPKPSTPIYIPPVSPMGLYSYAAEVAAKAKQAGKPEDLIKWLKSQPGVKMEELREAGAVKRDGSYDPTFAPGILKMTPNELAERLHNAIPEITAIERTEGKTIKLNSLDEYKQYLVNDESMWNETFWDQWKDFPDEQSRMNYIEDPYRVEDIAQKYNQTNGVVQQGATAEYGPSRYDHLTTEGGTDYAETLFSLGRYPDTETVKYTIKGGELSNVPSYSTPEQAQEVLSQLRDMAVRSGMYTESELARTFDDAQIVETKSTSKNPRNIESYGHMKGVLNNLGWTRKTRVPHPSGEGTARRVEETQSDIAQRSREEGFRLSPEELDDLRKEHDAAVKEYQESGIQFDDAYYKWRESIPNASSLSQLFGENKLRQDFVEKNPEYKEMNDRLDSLEKTIDQNTTRIRNNDQLLPRLPYMEDTQHWTDLFLKHELIQAVNGGDKSLQVITGDINRGRYAGYEDGDAGYHYDVNIPSSLKRVIKSIDPEAKVEKIKIDNKPSAKDDKKIEAAKDLIKYHEEKIAELQKVMGNVPEDSNAYRNAQYKIEESESDIREAQNAIENLTKPRNEFWSVEITPKMREVISKGLPRFEQGGRVGYASGGGIRDVSVDELQRMFEG